jgi:hypothetical protein
MIRSILSALVSTSLLFVPYLFAQGPGAVAGTSGCGAPEIKFDVNPDKEQRNALPETGKALVYFIEDDSNFASRPRPTTRVGIDGTWVGANHGNSYFHVAVDPGVHHLCASWQSAAILWHGRQTAAAHFTAEPGAVYYFEVRNEAQESGIRMDFFPIDSDEGQLLEKKFSHSSIIQKK